MDQAWGCGEVVLRPHTAHRTKNWSQVAVGGWRSLEAVLKGRGRRKLACAGGGGGSFEPLSPTPPPPFWAPVTGTPDRLTTTPNGLTGGFGGGGGGS